MAQLSRLPPVPSRSVVNLMSSTEPIEHRICFSVLNTHTWHGPTHIYFKRRAGRVRTTVNGPNPQPVRVPLRVASGRPGPESGRAVSVTDRLGLGMTLGSGSAAKDYS
jgi:hypothetical protein